MLPDRKISLTKKTEERLKRIKQKTGESINQLANERFFISLEKNFKVDIKHLKKTTMGEIKLEKSVWLGECSKITEVALKNLYPNATSDEIALIWAAHIDAFT